MPIYGSRSGGNPFMENLLGGMQAMETLNQVMNRNKLTSMEEEKLGFLRNEAERKATTNAILQARLRELGSMAEGHEQVASNLLPMHESGQIQLAPEQLSTLTGPAKSETGINVRDMIDSLVLGIPLNQMSTARLEDTKRQGEQITNRTAAEKLEMTRSMGELVARASAQNASPEDLANLRGIYAYLGVDPKNIIPEAGSPLEKSLFNLGLEEARGKVGKLKAETEHATAQAGQSRAETRRITARTPYEVGLLRAQTGQADTASVKNLAEAGKANQDVAESKSRQGKIKAEIDKLSIETQNSQVTMLTSALDSMAKNPTMAPFMTQENVSRMGLNFVAAIRQGGSVGDALSSSLDVAFPKEKKEEMINTLIKNKEAVTNMMPKIEKDDSPAMQGEKVAQSQDIIRGIFYEPVRDKIRQELGPKASEEEIAQRAILFLNQKIIPEFSPIRNERNQFIGFDSQYEKLKQPFSAKKRIQEADKKIIKGVKDIGTMMSEFFGRGDKVLETQDYYRQQRSKK